MAAHPPGLLARVAHGLRGAFAAGGRRSGDGFSTGGAGRTLPAYMAASQRSSVPQVAELGPFDAVKFFRPCQRLVRHQYRNDNWVRSLVNKTGELMMSTGPVPVSKFPELDDLWCAASGQFDSRGVSDLGGWLRDDLYRDYSLDGEAMVRRRARRAKRLVDGTFVPEAGLLVPLQWQSLGTHFLPTGHNRILDGGGRIVNGVELDALERRVAYHPYQRHPRDPNGWSVPGQTRVPADEFHHLHVPSETGAVRPEVPLAAGVLRSLKNAEFEDANAVIARNATCMSIMFEEDLPDGEDGPSEAEKQQFMDSIMLSPGMIGRAPTGMKMNMRSPPANPNFSPTIRLNLLYVCAGIGTPVHEVTGDYETITERAMSFAGISLRRKADIEHARVEHQVLNRMRRSFVDACVATGLWTPPPGRPLWEAYLCDWQWPAMQITRMSQELNSLVGAIKAEVIDPDTVTTSMFGMRPEVRARRAAKAAARNQALGFKTGAPAWGPEAQAAARILAEAIAEESRERDIVESSSTEDGPIDRDDD
ncbi:phage portal protein [Methylobacterium iners]|uniref:Phage portal protein n=1 Tax=Methylobacterium iners TaxID=418707 RepID=A0ABQ4S713_9HYPH|nr:phage portal protein [Methylobacterium iners]GJD97470.1 hypothetical protein OCOJLMKI_4701 [Methylobacterium iners]